MKKVAILILFMLGCAISEGHAQKVALKSNLLYDATTTMNLANASVIWGYNPKSVTGFVRVFAVCLSECMDIMPISM